MAVETIFGILDWGDENALREFISNHDQAHIDLMRTLGARGIALPYQPLSGPPDAPWFLNHWLLHRSLDQAFGVPGSPGLNGDPKTWQNPNTFYYWHQINNNAHLAYAQAGGGA